MKSTLALDYADTFVERNRWYFRRKSKSSVSRGAMREKGTSEHHKRGNERGTHIANVFVLALIRSTRSTKRVLCFLFGDIYCG